MTPRPRRDPRTTRHNTRTVARARKLAEAGWTAGEISRLLTQELRLSTPISVTTIRCWVEPGYREQHKEWQRRCMAGETRSETPDILLALRVDDGLSYSAIAAVARRFLGVDLSEDQVRLRLYELGVQKNPNKARANTMRSAA